MTSMPWHVEMPRIQCVGDSHQIHIMGHLVFIKVRYLWQSVMPRMPLMQCVWRMVCVADGYCLIYPCHGKLTVFKAKVDQWAYGGQHPDLYYGTFSTQREHLGKYTFGFQLCGFSALKHLNQFMYYVIIFQYLLCSPCICYK